MAIVDYLLTHATEQEAAAVRPRRIGAWNVGRCERALWYGEHGYEPLPLPATTRFVFDLGIAIEDLIRRRIAEACDHVIVPSPEQGELLVLKSELIGRAVYPDMLVMWPDRGILLESYPDGLPVQVLAGDEYGRARSLPAPGLMYPVDVKSMSGYPFERALGGQVDYAYTAQMEVYMRALGVSHGVLLCYDKETGLLCEAIVERSEQRWQSIQRAVALARADTIPARPYQALKGEMPRFPCAYCGYRQLCWEGTGVREPELKSRRQPKAGGSNGKAR